MSNLRLTGSTSGYVELASNSVASNNTLKLPNSGDSLVAQDASGNVNISGIITASSFSGNSTGLSGTPNIIVGLVTSTSGIVVTNGSSTFKGVVESVSTATTYMSGSAMVIEMDVRQSTVYTYTIPTGANIGIVSFKNMPAQTGNASGSTVTLITNQNSAGTGNTTSSTGIGTNCTVVGYENGSSVAGISTRALVGSATTVTLSTTGNDVDFISFFIQYNGGTNTVPSNYKVYVTKNGGFRQGTIGV